MRNKYQLYQDPLSKIFLGLQCLSPIFDTFKCIQNKIDQQHELHCKSAGSGFERNGSGPDCTNRSRWQDLGLPLNPVLKLRNIFQHLYARHTANTGICCTQAEIAPLRYFLNPNSNAELMQFVTACARNICWISMRKLPFGLERFFIWYWGKYCHCLANLRKVHRG